MGVYKQLECGKTRARRFSFILAYFMHFSIPFIDLYSASAAEADYARFVLPFTLLKAIIQNRKRTRLSLNCLSPSQIFRGAERGVRVNSYIVVLVKVIRFIVTIMDA